MLITIAIHLCRRSLWKAVTPKVILMKWKHACLVAHTASSKYTWTNMRRMHRRRWHARTSWIDCIPAQVMCKSSASLNDCIRHFVESCLRATLSFVTDPRTLRWMSSHICWNEHVGKCPSPTSVKYNSNRTTANCARPRTTSTTMFYMSTTKCYVVLIGPFFPVCFLPRTGVKGNRMVSLSMCCSWSIKLEFVK